jgi:membrane protein YqaA with SNARE-associated domain
MMGQVPSAASLWRPPRWLSFAWGFAESTFFFMVPDIILGWACLSGWRDGLRALVAVMAGSLFGGLLVYAAAARWPDATRDLVASVPFVRLQMFDEVEESFGWQGAAGMLAGPSSGIPYKVYAVLAPHFFGAASFLLMSVPARLERLLLSVVVFAGIGRFARTRITRHPTLTVVAYALCWAAVYAVYWARP